MWHCVDCVWRVVVACVAWVDCEWRMVVACVDCEWRMVVACVALSGL